MRVENRDPDTLDRPEWNSLQENYEKHDDAEATFLEQLPEWVEVEAFGIDRRHEDEQLIYDEKPDFRLHVDGEPQALVDVKSKSRHTYMQECNERHYRKYVAKADELDLPALVWFYNIAEDTGVLCDATDVATTTSEHGLDSWPDGNNRARLKSTVSWNAFIQELQS